MKTLHQTLIEELQGEFVRKQQNGDFGNPSIDADRIEKYLAQVVTKTLERVLGEMFRIHKESWNDAEHCTCLPYAISTFSEEWEKKVNEHHALTTNKEEETTKEEVKHHCLDLNDCICE